MLLTQLKAAIIHPMKIRDVGEFRLIELLAEVVGRAESSEVVVGIGDDAAVWRGDRSLQLGTTDAMIGGVHFSPENATWAEIGWKALAMNISDIAAMGGRPAYALVSLGLPGETEVDQVTDLYRGLMESAEEFGVSVVGGNVSSSPVSRSSPGTNGAKKRTGSLPKGRCGPPMSSVL